MQIIYIKWRKVYREAEEITLDFISSYAYVNSVFGLYFQTDDNE